MADKCILKTFQCGLCLQQLLKTNDVFMPVCCQQGLVCEGCYHQGYGMVLCKLCGRYASGQRISFKFLTKVEEEVNQREQLARKNREQEVWQGIKEFFMLRRGVGEWEIYKKVSTILNGHVHAKRCRPYQNIKYMCMSVNKLTREGGVQRVTIHDVLAFQCMFCGHGDMNRIVQEGGEQSIGCHRMFECKRECCGEYLDRRYLQYGGGNCECGVLVMEAMGVIPASEEQNKWRRELYDRREEEMRTNEVRERLGTIMNNLGIRTYHMLVWFMLSKGREKFEEIMQMDEQHKTELLSSFVDMLKAEYGRHKPIQ